MKQYRWALILFLAALLLRHEHHRFIPVTFVNRTGLTVRDIRFGGNFERLVKIDSLSPGQRQSARVKPAQMDVGPYLEATLDDGTPIVWDCSGIGDWAGTPYRVVFMPGGEVVSRDVRLLHGVYAFVTGLAYYLTVFVFLVMCIIFLVRRIWRPGQPRMLETE